MQTLMTNPATGEKKIIKAGFSWILFLFTPFYGIPLFIRGLYLHGAIVAAIGVFALLVDGSPAMAIAGLLLIASMVFYGIKGNELTMQSLASKGWSREGDEPQEAQAGDTSPQLSSGSAPKDSSKLTRGIAIGAAVVVGLIIIGMAVGPAEPGSDHAQIDAVTTAEQIPPISVTATELFSAYEANEQAAQMQYGDQPIEISGRIASIELDILDQPVVTLESGNLFGGVSLHFSDEHASTTAQLSRGEIFFARCESVTEILGLPQLEKCEPIS